MQTVFFVLDKDKKLKFLYSANALHLGLLEICNCNTNHITMLRILFLKKEN